MDEFRVASWNICGLGKAVKRSAVRKFRILNKIQVLFIQESKLEKNERGLGKALWGDSEHEMKMIKSKGASGGLISIWDKKYFELEDSVESFRFLAIVGEVKSTGMKIGFINVYASCNAAERRIMFDELEAVIANYEVNWVIGGDFNVVRNQDERTGNRTSLGGSDTFNSFIADSGLVDLPLQNEKFTWSNHRDEIAKSRLDRFLISPEILLSFPDLKQLAFPKTISDHAVITLTREVLDWGKRPFKCFDYWLDIAGFDKAVKGACEKAKGCGIGSVLKGSKVAIKEWKTQQKEVDFAMIPKLEDDIKNLESVLLIDPSNTKVQGAIRHLRARVWNLYWMEERKWHQQSRLKWDSFGDRNTKFYHLVASGRKRANAISQVERDGRIVSNPGDVKAAIHDHFASAYKKSRVYRVADIKGEFRSLSDASRRELEKRFTEEEIWQVINTSNGSKAPGPDGFNLNFFKKYWNQLKDEIMKLFDEFFDTGRFDVNLNHSFITMVPKVVDSKDLDDYRPISLVGGAYKVLSKVLAKRLSKCMNEVIGESQFAFIPGRQLVDCSLIANEIIDLARRKDEKIIVFKADIRKAYDSLDWGFIDFALAKLGFGDVWRKWMQFCISTASISILVNGAPTERFFIEKGLRQGCSLSPPLFNLAAEVLNVLLNKAVSKGLFEGVKVGSGNLQISHLQFADDLVVFCGGQLDQVLNIKRVLKVFEWMSGLRLNLLKTNMYGVNMEIEEVQVWADAVGCKAASLPTSYLGLPLGATRNSETLWKPIFTKVEKKLAAWKSKFLSMGGKVTLLKSVIASLPIFFMSLFKMPMGVIKKINGLMAKFLWGANDKRAIHWLNWEVVSRSKEAGGLELINLSLKNMALLSKWKWRFGSERDSLWKRVIIDKYEKGEQKLFPSEPLKGKSSWVWRDIYSIGKQNTGDTFSANTRIVVGDGVSVDFWDDHWVGEGPLKHAFPRVYALSTKKAGKICDFGEWSSGLWSWNVPLRRKCFNWEEEQWNEFNNTLVFVPIHHDIHDSIRWTASSSGVLTSKEYYEVARKELENETSKDEAWEYLWLSFAPPKVEIFSWQVMWERIPVKTELKRRKSLNSDSVLCDLCRGHEESVCHLLFQCYGVWRIWQKAAALWGFNLVMPSSPKSCFMYWINSFVGSKQRKLVWILLFHAILWSTWLCRNNIIFENKAFDFNLLWNVILLRLGAWCRAAWPLSWNSMEQFILQPQLFVPKGGRLEKIQKSADMLHSVEGYVYYVDAAVLGNVGPAGIGGVLVDDRGNKVECFSKYIGTSDPSMAELAAIEEAISRICSNHPFRSEEITIATDCLNLAQWFHAPNLAPSPIKEHIQVCYHKFISARWNIVHIHRELNMQANALARNGMLELF